MSNTRSIARFAGNCLVLPAHGVAVLLAAAGAGAVLGGATRQDAEAAALSRCGAAACTIEVSFQGGCVAYASAHKHAGSGTGPNLLVATQQALGQCNKNSCRVAVQYYAGQ